MAVSLRWSCLLLLLGLSGCASTGAPSPDGDGMTDDTDHPEATAAEPQEYMCTASPDGVTLALVSQGFASACFLTTTTGPAKVVESSPDADCAVRWSHADGTPMGQAGEAAVHQTFEGDTTLRLACGPTNVGGSGRLVLAPVG